MYKSTYDKMNWFKSTFLDKNNTLDILDVGSLNREGNKNYKSIFNKHNCNYVGLDYEKDNNLGIIVEDIHNWFEVNDNKFDVILYNQLGNMSYFWLIMVQIERILKDDGYVCIIVPTVGSNYDNNQLNCYQFCENGLKQLVIYVDLYLVDISTNDIKPCDVSCLVSRKNSDLIDVNNIENKINHFESKLDKFLNFIE